MNRAALPPKTRQEAEELSLRGARLAALRKGAIAARDTAVVEAGNVNKARIERLTRDLREIDKALSFWAHQNRAEFSEKKELTLAGAVLSFRLGNRCLRPTEDCDDEKEGFKKALSKMMRLGKVLKAWRQWVKVEFKLDVRKILSDSAGKRPVLTEEKLSGVGLAVCQRESFKVEYNVHAKP